MKLKIDFAYKLKISKKKIMKFYNDNWKNKILTNNKYYNWQFINSNNHKFDKNVIAYDLSDHKILGVMGVSDRFFFLNKKKIKGAELTTWCTDQNYINIGIGPKILDFLKKNYDLLIGMGITKKAIEIYLRKEFMYIKSIPRYLKVFNFNNIKNNAVYGSFFLKFIRNRNAEIKNYKYFYKKPNKLDLKTLENGFLKKNNFFSRDYQKVRWRLINHPFYKYQNLIISDHINFKKKILISYRIEEINSFKIMRVIDFFGDEKIYKHGLTFINHICKKHNIDVADFFCTNQEINKYFLNDKWLSMLDCEFFKFPHLFEPIELRDPSSSSMIFWTCKDFLDLNNLSKLYITKSDCDFDRPTRYN